MFLTTRRISDGEIRPPVDAKVAQSAEAGDLETLQKIVQRYFVSVYLL